jgi:hypothetical protein
MKTAHCYICGRERGRGKMVEIFIMGWAARGNSGRRTVMVCPHHMGVKGLHRVWEEEKKKSKA